MQQTQALWFLSRASGVVLLVLLTGVTVLGILPRARHLPPSLGRPGTLGLHRSLSLLAIVFLIVHIGTAILDPFAPIDLVDATVPFLSEYRPVWLGMGALAADVFATLVITSLLRSRMSFTAWRLVHLSSYTFWPIALLHVLATGSDARTPWMGPLVAACLVAVMAAIGLRLARSADLSRSRQLVFAATASLVALVLLIWSIDGPLGPGWAAKAGTPTAASGQATPSLPPLPANPFCAIPAGYRDLLLAGYRADRSADAFMLTKAPAIVGDEGAWPSLESAQDTYVPLAFAGAGAPAEADGASLADIAPTVAQAAGVRWPFPAVLEGEALPGATGPRPRTIVMIAWKGVGSEDLEAARGDWPYLEALGREGTLSLDVRTRSLPVDTTAALTTIGTGTLPSTHGMTGRLIRVPGKEPVEAWGPDSPTSVTLALGDAFTHSTRGDARVAAVLDERSDRGIVGGTWYEGFERPDRTDVRIAASPAEAARQVEALLQSGVRKNDAPDLLGVTLDGDIAVVDAATRLMVDAARRVSGARTLAVVVGTGSASSDVAARATPEEVAKTVEFATGAGSVQAVQDGGLFLDASPGMKSRSTETLEVLRSLDPAGESITAYAYSGLSVAYGDPCGQDPRQEPSEYTDMPDMPGM